jgi:predicted porin
MNKKLIALAVAGASLAPAAMAQTANPVTLYGRIYATFETVEAKGAGTAAAVPRRNRVSDESSYLGVRGTEDLGGGLKAFFQLETAFKPDQNDSAFAARNSAVGLQGGWGSVLLGRWDSPFKVTTTAVDPFGDLTLGGITAALNGSGVANQNDTLDRRDINVVQYWSPTWAGLAIRAEYSANEGKACTTTGTTTTCVNPVKTSASLTWTRGPIYVGYAWDEQTDTLFGTTLMTKMTGQAVFGSFVIGPIKLGAIVEDYKKNPASGPSFAKQKMWAASAVYTIGSHQIMYQHQDAKDGGSQGTTAAPIQQPNCKVDALAYQYNFSRRTFAILQYTKIDNSDTATCNFGSTQLAISAGQDLTGLMFGLRHIF